MDRALPQFRYTGLLMFIAFNIGVDVVFDVIVGGVMTVIFVVRALILALVFSF